MKELIKTVYINMHLSVYGRTHKYLYTLLHKLCQVLKLISMVYIRIIIHFLDSAALATCIMTIISV